MTKTKIFLVAIVALVIGLLGGVAWHVAETPSSGNLGGLVYDTQHFAGDVYMGMADTLVFHNGLIVGPIVQSLNSVFNVISNIATNGLIEGASGFSQTFNTSTVLTAAQFCSTTNQRFVGGPTSGAVMTSTLPSATSTWQLCGNAGGFGAWNYNLITNDSTSTINMVAGPGQIFQCETNGVGTTTVVGGCTNSFVSINPSSTVQVTGYWDAGSSTFHMLWGNQFHNN